MTKPEFGYDPATRDFVKICVECGTTDVNKHHLAIRCAECQKLANQARKTRYKRTFKEKHREEWLAKDREEKRKYRAEHPERVKAAKKRDYERKKAKLADMQSRIEALESELASIKLLLTENKGNE
jgi:uncharacterized Zn finger protein (UPF0148 family)